MTKCFFIIFIPLPQLIYFNKSLKIVDSEAKLGMYAPRKLIVPRKICKSFTHFGVGKFIIALIFFIIWLYTIFIKNFTSWTPI